MSITLNLLGVVIAAAKAAGMDQKKLAREAGISAETISRAKRRGTVDLDTLHRLAEVAGLSLQLVSAKEPTAPTPKPPGQALVREALRQGQYSGILDAAVQFGIDYVRGEWAAICVDDTALSPKTRAHINTMLHNIATGFNQAQH
jgi:transcriptional regulator with XRE-family HTH domain